LKRRSARTDLKIKNICESSHRLNITKRFTRVLKDTVYKKDLQ